MIGLSAGRVVDQETIYPLFTVSHGPRLTLDIIPKEGISALPLSRFNVLFWCTRIGDFVEVPFPDKKIKVFDGLGLPHYGEGKERRSKEGFHFTKV